MWYILLAMRRPSRRTLVRLAAAVTAVVALLWCLGDGSPVGHFGSAADKLRFVAAYDRAMAALPPPQQVRDIRTAYGIVRVYRFAGANDDKAPLLLLPGRAAPTPVWADNLAGFLALRTVYTIDLLGRAGPQRAGSAPRHRRGSGRLAVRGDRAAAGAGRPRGRPVDRRLDGDEPRGATGRRRSPA